MIENGSFIMFDRLLRDLNIIKVAKAFPISDLRVGATLQDISRSVIVLKVQPGLGSKVRG